jgi:hypothetical protein
MDNVINLRQAERLQAYKEEMYVMELVASLVGLLQLDIGKIV